MRIEIFIGNGNTEHLLIRRQTDLKEGRMQNEKHNGSESERALLTCQRRYERMANTIPVMLYDSVLTSDETSRFLYVSPEQCREILELDPDALLKDMSLVWEIVHPDDLARFHQEDVTAHKRGKEFLSEVRIITHSGRLKWLLVNSNPNPVEPGEPVVWSGYLQDITARKKAEARLRETEQKLRLVVEKSTNLFYMHTADHVLTYISPQSRQFFDCEPDEAMVRWTEFLTDNPANNEAVRATQRAIDTGQRQPPYEVECIGKKGRKIWVEVHEAPIIENDRTVAISGTLTDITKRKQAQKEREHFYKFFQTSADLMCVADPDGRFIKTNPAFTEVLGYSEAELVSREILHFIHPEDRQATLDEIEKQKGTGFTDSFENRYICKNGNVKWLSWRVTFSKEEGIAYATARDITEKKQAEETLRESQSLLLTILENVPIRVFWKDADLNYLGCNTAFARSAGFLKPEDLLGKDDFQMCWHDQAEEFRTDDRQVMTSEVPGIGIEKSLTTPEGQMSWVRTSKVPLYDMGGKVIGMLGIDEDISEQKKKAEEKARLEVQLHQSQKIESVGRLAGGVAHDYNNMLSVIIGYAELAQMKLDQKDAVQEDLEEILIAARRSRDITRQLLAFARKQTIDPKILDLNTSIEGTLKMLRNLLGENIDLVWKPQKGILRVEMDPSQLDQVLVNVCINARDAIVDVGTLTIETGKTHFDQAQCAQRPGLAPGAYVMLAISDNGCGMAPEILEHIFDPFFTTKKVGEGTGLGLAMVYGVVKQNNGYIEVYSEPEHGTTIKIYLPEHTGQPPAESERTLENVPHSHGETVLLVEDEVSILNLAKTQLKSLNYHVLEASTPREALTIAETLSGKIDLLLTDVVMPEMNGRELADRLHLMYPQLRCLYMSGYTDDAIAHHGVLDKGVHFLPKPFSARELAVNVRKVLDLDT